MDRDSKPMATPGQKPNWKIRRRLVRAVIGLCILIGLVYAGGNAQKDLHLSLPGPVIGLALLAALFLLVERLHTRSQRYLTLHLTPISRLLVSHMGLLFVPAGVGIITEGETLRREWLPIVAALIGSTLIGLAATGWCMHRFAPQKPSSKT
jgi:holin-like protein